MRKIASMLLLLLISLALKANPTQGLINNSGNAQDYPGSNLLILFDSTEVDVKDTGLGYFHMHQLIKILTKQGALEKRVICIDYDPLSADVEFKMVKIYRKDGTIQELDLANVLDYVAPARAIYWGASEKMIEIGRLEPGDAIEIRYFKKGFTYALLMQDDEDRFIPPMRGHYYDIVPFWSSEPILKKVYVAKLPPNKPLQFEFYNGTCSASVRFENGKHVYSFTQEDILPLKREPNMVDPFDVAPKLLLTTSPDWEAKSRWFYGVNEDYGSFEPTPETVAFVRELLNEAKTEMDSVSVLTHWVADNMRYSGISMGPGEGFTLHNTGMNFRDRCGVCKDKAALLISFLRIAGFESYAAMTMAGSRIEDIPADHFNHSVTVVKLSDGKYHLLDPTWVPFVRELWSSAEQQQHYLMGLPEGADLMATPISPPDNHYLRINGTSELKPDGTLVGELTVEAEGQTDAAIRGMFTRDYKSQWDRSVEAELLRVYPKAQILSMDYGDPIDYMAGPINLKINYQIPGFAFAGARELFFVPLLSGNFMSRAMGHLSLNTDLAERKYAFRDRCSRLVQLNETITLPQEYEVVLPMQQLVHNGQAASYKGGFVKQGNTLVINQEVILGKRVYEPEDWPEVRAAVQAHKNMAEMPVILKKL
ncbi:MAG: DUF3857 and transglutaminase domain-containing protein [Bacteroidales bacterium]|nr:DUF3857 and transglutaminase domain-containing protein [Bacteroidales bacterium]MDZ4203867.1 DUF3857 and transglutaminase domain-containing protein [Bacteroidales bacterium]